MLMVNVSCKTVNVVIIPTVKYNDKDMVEIYDWIEEFSTLTYQINNIIIRRYCKVN